MSTSRGKRGVNRDLKNNYYTRELTVNIYEYNLIYFENTETRGLEEAENMNLMHQQRISVIYISASCNICRKYWYFTFLFFLC